MSGDKDMKRELEDTASGPAFFIDTEGAVAEKDRKIKKARGRREKEKLAKVEKGESYAKIRTAKSLAKREKGKADKAERIRVVAEKKALRAKKAEKTAERASKANDSELAGDSKPADDSVINDNEQTNDNESIFFGIVDRTELEYFKTAESTLAANAFSDNDERDGFIAGVLQEASGKELKLVTNQICSKLVERLILFASNRQLLQIFKTFSGHFLNLSKHKYSSHCVETLMVRSAALVEKEMLASSPSELYKEEDETTETDATLTMESLFIAMVDELKPELKQLIYNEYASHVIRLLLLILSGSKLPATSGTSSVRSKKSKIARKMISIADNEEYENSYQVPSSFKQTLQDILIALTQDINTVAEARELAIHKIASPVVQSIVKLECNASSSSKKKQRKKVSASSTVTNLLFQMDPNSDKESTEESFIEYLLSDPIGLYFFESVINDSLPTSTIQRLYTQYMSDRLDKLVKRDGVSNFIFPALLKKLAPEQVKEILDVSISLLDVLINSNNYIIVKAILASSKSSNYKVDEITKLVENKFDYNNSSKFLEKVLHLEGSLQDARDGDWPTNEERHRALFAESLVGFSAKFLKAISEGFIELPEQKLLEVTKHAIFSHVLQACLVPESEIVVRRRLLNNLTDHVTALACNAYGSHLVDALWKYTFKLKFFRERIAEQLIKDSTVVKNSIYGKIVWKNWELEKYVRKRFEWWILVKEGEDAIAETLGQSRSEIESKQKKPEPRSKFRTTGANAESKTGGGPRKFKFKGTGANTGPVGRAIHAKPYDRPNKT